MTLTPDYPAMRRAMVDGQLRTNGINDPALVASLLAVPREAFVPAESAAACYTDRPVSLGGGRWLNPPLATALLVDAAAVRAGRRVLIVGAATGYAMALCIHLGANVVGVESDPALAALARRNVADARLVEGALTDGASDAAPFDCIVVDGAVAEIPEVLVEQLAGEGRLAAAVVDRRVTRLAVGRRGGSGFAMADFVDAEAVALPGFSRAKTFAF